MKKIIAFGAHPDDVEFGCGALLIKEIKAGNKVKIVVCSLGEAGTNGTASSRKAEATSAAKFIGAEIEFVSLGGDCHITDNAESRIKIAKIIRKYKPNIVLATSQSNNQHPDHLALSNIVRSASRYARYGGLKELKGEMVHSIDALYYFPSSGEIEKRGDIIIDVSVEYEMWEKAMSMHKSQMKTRSYINLIESRAKYLGATIGTNYATALWVNDSVRLEKISDINISSRNF